MKLQILSDLHLEFDLFNPPPTAADVTILAGDIHVGTKAIDWAISNFPDRPVIYVLGNHEYYGKAYPKHIHSLQKLAAGTNIRILENERLTIVRVASPLANRVTFLGCTLWTDFQLYGEPKIAGISAMQVMTDYRKIRVSPEYRKLRAIDTAIVHNKSINWLQTEAAKLQERGEKFVIITHHAPSKRSISKRDREDILSAAYASDLDRFVADSGATLWIHGHVHHQLDYAIGNTRIICNPRGYPDDRNQDFQPDLIVEL